MADLTYVTIAYRWGCTNLHQYRVYAGPQRETAIAHAVAENADRGGKYGCAVYEYTENGTVERLIHYAGAGMHGEKRPFHNHRIDLLESLGHKFARYAEGREHHVEPEGRGGKVLMVVKERPCQPPQWVVDAHKSALSMCETMERMQNEHEVKVETNG